MSALMVLAMAAALVSSETVRPPKYDNAAIVGVWRGQEGDLPAATLTVAEEVGEFAGAILFYLIRHDEGKPPSSSPGIPEPLFSLKFDGKNLMFLVSHRRAHPGTSSDPPVKFRLKLTGPNEAMLIAGEGTSGAKMKMVRDH
jgi:hypothetical protein